MSPRGWQTLEGRERLTPGCRSSLGPSGFLFNVATSREPAARIPRSRGETRDSAYRRIPAPQRYLDIRQFLDERGRIAEPAEPCFERTDRLVILSAGSQDAR